MSRLSILRFWKICFDRYYADSIVDKEDNQVVIEALADYIVNIDFDAYVKLRATAFRVAGK